MGELIPLRADRPADVEDVLRRRAGELRRELAALNLLNAIRERRTRGLHNVPGRELRALAEALGLDPTTLLTPKDTDR